MGLGQGGLQKETPLLAWCRMVSDLRVGEDGLGTKSCSGGGRYPLSGAPPRPRSFRNLGKVVPRRSSPAVPVPGSCCRRKVSGDGSRHGGAWGVGGLPRKPEGCCSVRCPRCSGDARRLPGDAAQDSQGMLPAMLGGCCPGCSGRCLPGW